MTRRELASRVTDALNANNIRKSLPAQKTTFHITDDQGDKKDFVIRKERTGVKYTVDDIDVILEACAEAIIDAIKHGEKVAVSKFGCLSLKKRAARISPHPVTGETQHIKEHFVVKFDCYKDLKTAAALYTIQSEDRQRAADDILAGRVSFNDYEEDVIDDVRD